MAPVEPPKADVPIVDFAQFLNGSAQDRKAIAAQIDDAFRKVGFVHLKNHGVPEEKVEACFDWVGFSLFFFARHRLTLFATRRASGSSTCPRR